MSFVAEPYLNVADQVLTALTGGVARETHRFFAGANAFSFEIGGDRVEPESVRAIGQAGGAFFAFQPGRDFTIGRDGVLRFLAADAEPGEPPVTAGRRPADGATWPDEATEFHVGYYPVDTSGALLTDRNVGSVTRTLAEAFARELAVLRTQLEGVYRSAFVDTAEGRSLDMVVALLGVERKARDFAVGAVRFFRDVPAPADIFIPEGTRVSTALAMPMPEGGPPRPVSFVTTSGRTLARGQLSVEAPLRCEEQGPRGVVDAGAIDLIDQTVLGISAAINDAPTVFGAAGETDDELRRRAKAVAERAGRATPRALTNALAGIGPIRENDVKIVEQLGLRPGVVEVFVAADPTPQLAVSVEQAILATRAAGIRVEHNLQTFLPTATLPLASNGDLRDDGTTAPDGAAGGDFRFALAANVTIFPEDPRVAGGEKDAIQTAVTAAIAGYVEASSIGDVLVYNRMSAGVMAVPGVYDAVLDVAPLPETPQAPVAGKRNIDVPEGRRAVIDAATSIRVTFAGAPLSFDFQIAVTPKGGSGLDAIRAELRARLTSYFASLSGSLDTAALQSLLGVSDLYELDIADVAWTAEYEQAGLIIREGGGAAAATEIPEGTRPVLRDVAVVEAIA